MTFCEVILIGNVGRDSQLSYTASGRAVCSFSLATNRTWNNRDTNEKQTETTWFRVTIWGPQAEALHQYITKGTQVLVVGNRIQAKTYDSEGQQRVSLEVTADTVRLLGSRGGSGSGAPGYSDADYPYGGGASGGNDYGGTPEVDDIPF